jgi:hypothetical protein
VWRELALVVDLTGVEGLKNRLDELIVAVRERDRYIRDPQQRRGARGKRRLR